MIRVATQPMSSVAKIVQTRFPIVGLGIVALLAALWGALVRLGWNLPPILAGLPNVHGPLMVSGFLGTLIGMERAVALRVHWAYSALLLSVLGALVLMSNLAPVAGALLIVLGSVGMRAIFFSLWQWAGVFNVIAVLLYCTRALIALWSRAFTRFLTR